MNQLINLQNAKIGIVALAIYALSSCAVDYFTKEKNPEFSRVEQELEQVDDSYQDLSNKRHLLYKDKDYVEGKKTYLDFKAEDDSLYNLLFPIALKRNSLIAALDSIPEFLEE